MQRLCCQNSTKIETAYVMINCEGGMESHVVNELSLIANIKEILPTDGRYDVVMKIEASSIESLRDLITFKIRKMYSIRSTTTLICEGSPFPY